MSAWKPPGSDTLASRIARLERQISEQSRSYKQPDRIKVNLALTNGGIIAGESRLVTSWDSYAEVDTANMYRRNIGGATYIEIPYPGRWKVVYSANWGRRNDGGNRLVGCWIKLNDNVSVTINNNMIAYQAMQRPNIPEFMRSVATADRVFNAGDHISFGLSNETAGARLIGRDHTISTMPTYFMAEYIGPN